MYEHKSIEDVLNEKVTLKDSSKAFYKEMKKNLALEAVCILACEAGEWATEILAFMARMPFQNELGILGGISVGGSYALYHVYKHARKHAERASLMDAAGYVATTESGCIVGATLSEYAAGKFITTTNNPLALDNAVIRASALVPAFAVGLVLMSAFTYVKRKEVGRWVGEKGALKRVNPKNGLEYCLSRNKLEIRGGCSSFSIKEKDLPATYCPSFDKEKNSLYLLSSKVARAKPEYSHVLEGYCEDLFREAGCALTPVRNVYACTEHDH